MPTTSPASMPMTSCFSVVSISLATAVCARPWCDSPQPTRPPAVLTLTTTASRFTAVPMPSVTRCPGGTGNEVGKAETSTILRSARATIGAFTVFSRHPHVAEKDAADLRAVGLGRARASVGLPGLLHGQRKVMGAGQLQGVSRRAKEAQPAGEPGR